MPKKKSNARKPKNKKNNRKSLRKILFFVVLLFVAGAAAFVAYTFCFIQKEFDGVRWALPARVYARPLELYAGKNITLEQIQYELNLLNYESVNFRSLSPGLFRINTHVIDVFTREFVFDDGQSEGCYCRIRLSSKGVDSIIDLRSKQKRALLRFEPYHYSSIYPLLKEDRDIVSLDDVPDLLIDMLLAVEDKDFYMHHGVKPTAIMRALFANIRAGRTVQGGSTLTQQLVKNFFLTSERSLSRKAHEAIIAVLLELKYNKREILEAYLNEVYLGQQGERAIHGFSLASRHYFNRSLNRLRADELAMLVGLVKGPSMYNPFKNKQNAIQRRNTVLAIARHDGIISASEDKALKNNQLSVGKSTSQQTAYPAYIDFLKRQLAEDYSRYTLSSEGLRIFSSIDPYIQHVAEKMVQKHLLHIERQKNMQQGALQAAVIVLDTSNAEVVAMVGGRNPRFKGFNRALYARRSIGSLLKPFIYLEALSHYGVFTPASLLKDQPLQLRYDGQGWSPMNYDKQFHGDVPLFEALANSYNVSAVNTGITIGVANVIKRVKGILGHIDIEPYPSILLGAMDLSPIDIARLYYPLATQGYQSSFRAAQSVLTARGERVQAYPLKIKQIIDDDLSYQINYLMQYIVQTGTARHLGSGATKHLRLAAKTGTSNDLRDSWLVTYSGKHLIVVWVGNDANKPIGLTGASGGLPIAQQIFSRIASRPFKPRQPKHVKLHWVDKTNGKLSKEKCENSVIMPFIAGTELEEMAKCSRVSLFKRIFGH